MHRVGQNHIYIRCIYGLFGRGIIKYTVIYGAYIRFWTTLRMHKQRMTTGAMRCTRRNVQNDHSSNEMCAQNCMFAVGVV